MDTTKTYRLDAGFDFSIALEIDTAKLTEAKATEINEFWGGSQSILDLSEGDVHQAVARRAAGPLLCYLVDDCSASLAIERLCEREGWLPEDELGIKILDFDLPNLDAFEFEVTELPEEG